MCGVGFRPGRERHRRRTFTRGYLSRTELPHSKNILLSGLLLTGMAMGLPCVSYGAATSCTNVTMMGTYNAEVTSFPFLNLLTSFSASTPSSGASVTTGPMSTGRGFGNNPMSLSGAIPGSGRYYFDGAGNIWGRQSTGSGPNMNAVIGRYDIANDCTGTVALNTGEHFNLVLVGGGGTALFLQNDANAGGSIGQLDRAIESCIGPNAFPTNFGFSFFGARPTAAGSPSATTPSVAPYSAVGEVRLLENGEFRLFEWLYTAASVRAVASSGTYSVVADCSLRLTFSQNIDLTGGSTGAVNFPAPATLRGTLNRAATKGEDTSTGILVIQPSDVTVVLGRFVSQ